MTKIKMLIEDVEQPELSSATGENAKMLTATLENCLAVSYTVKHTLTI